MFETKSRYDLESLKKWVYREFKIDLSAYKENQLHRRLDSFLGRVGAKSVDDFINIVKNDPIQKQKFLDFITINVSEFFRNPEIFDDLEEKIKNDLLKSNSNLKIWSAACSIGAEPYSVGIILDKTSTSKNHKIIATDIDSTILERAKKGEYAISEIKNVKAGDLSKYFTKVSDKYKINDNIKRMITFKKHDLILDSYEKDFDLIICRNVVIYFNSDVKDEIYRKFSSSLKKGGILFVGATESIYNYKDFGFEKLSTFIYKKI